MGSNPGQGQAVVSLSKKLNILIAKYWLVGRECACKLKTKQKEISEHFTIK